MKYVKIVINDTIIIDDINETYICIYFPENIKNFRNNNYNNFKIVNNFKQINFIKNNRFVIDYKNKNFKFYILFFSTINLNKKLILSLSLIFK